MMMALLVFTRDEERLHRSRYRLGVALSCLAWRFACEQYCPPNPKP